MFLWFAGGSFVIVVFVFADAAIDYRLVMAGALAPDLIDGIFGRAGVAHTLAASAATLVAVMVATRRRRLVRRRLLALPIGMLLHLVLDGAWTRTKLFWWPAFGWRLGRSPVPSFDRPILLLAGQEVVGLAALVWMAGRFDLRDRRRRSRFLRDGRLDRDLLR